MTGAEKGFLLLTSCLGNPDRQVLTTAQLRLLAQRMRQQPRPEEDRDLSEQDIVSLGYSREMAKRMLKLLSEEELLQLYCRRGERAFCQPLTWVTEGYPKVLRQRLGEESPGCLWYKGDVSLLMQPKVALVGSREILERNREFASEVGRQAAKQGYVLVSGNARGADQVAQQACLNAGGCVISVVADCLTDKPLTERMLHISEENFDAEFSARRALSRNRVIHTLGEVTFVAQCGYHSGGTWDGTLKNLRYNWSPVCCYRDGSVASGELEQMGAALISMQQLDDFRNLPRQSAGFFEE